MFTLLKDQIKEKVKVNKDEKLRYISRSIKVIISFDLETLKNRYYEIFPIYDKNLETFYPWIGYESGDLLKEIIITTFSAETLENLTKRGYECIDFSDQIIVVGDITEKEGSNKINNFINVFKEIVNELDLKNIFKIGIFIIGNIETLKKTERNTKNNIVTLPEINFFDKIYFLDRINTQKALITNKDEIYTLISYLIRFLQTKPVQIRENGTKTLNFGEWIKQSGVQEKKCCSFSGFTIFFPIEYILETVLIMKGGELIEKSFISDFPKEKTDFYFKNFLNEFSMEPLDSFVKKLKENTKIISPLSFENLPLPYEMPDKVKILSEYFNELEINLPNYASINKEILKKESIKFLTGFKYKLTDYLDYILKHEKGGVLLAIEFLNKLYEYFEKNQGENNIENGELNIKEKILQLEKECENGPRKYSLILRTIISILPLVFTFNILNSFKPRMILILLSFFIVGGSYIVWDAWTTRVLRIFQDIKIGLEKKWTGLMERIENDILKNMIEEVKNIVKESQTEMEKIKTRIEKIVKFSKEEYFPSYPSLENSFLNYLIDIPNSPEENGRESRDFIKYIECDIEKLAEEFIREQHPLEYWKRFFSPTDENFNNWEYSLIEKSSLKFIPFTNTLINLSICEILKERTEKKEKIFNLLKRFSHPYIILKPGSSEGELKALLEIPSQKCELVENEFIDFISKYLGNLETKKIHSPYRISLYTVKEGINIDDVKIGGG